METPVRPLDPTSQKATPEVRVSYPYSLIPGGIRSDEDFERARESDSMLEQHYADVGALRPEAPGKERQLFASYRRDGRIFWTAKRVHLAAREAVFTDKDGNEIRGRCGNRLSNTPRQPVAFVEPPELDTPRLEISMPPPEPELVPGPLAPPDLVVPLPSRAKPAGPVTGPPEQPPGEPVPSAGWEPPPVTPPRRATPRVTVTPEPGTLALFAIAVGAAAIFGLVSKTRQGRVADAEQESSEKG